MTEAYRGIPASSALIDTVIARRKENQARQADVQEAKRHIPDLQQLTADFIVKHVAFPPPKDIFNDQWRADLFINRPLVFDLELSCKIPVREGKDVFVLVFANMYPLVPNKTQYAVKIPEADKSFVLERSLNNEKLRDGFVSSGPGDISVHIGSYRCGGERDMGAKDVREYRELIIRLMQDDVVVTPSINHDSSSYKVCDSSVTGEFQRKCKEIEASASSPR